MTTYDNFKGVLAHKHNVGDIVGLPDTSYTNQWYGVKRLIGQTSSTLTRIGNTDLHKVNGGLPVQSLMRRCILKADGTINYYLGATDSTKNSAGGTAILDGTDGHVMVEIPEHYVRFWTETSRQRHICKCSY